MALHPALVNILHCEQVRVFDQIAELKIAMKLHQARMKQVCQSIKDYGAQWLQPPYMRTACFNCESFLPLVFDMGRHRGRCTKLDLTGSPVHNRLSGRFSPSFKEFLHEQQTRSFREYLKSHLS